MDPKLRLFGWKKNREDIRDFRLENFLGLNLGTPAGDATNLIAAAESELRLTTVTFQRWAATDYGDGLELTHWWRALKCLTDAKAILNPPAPPAPGGGVEWLNSEPTLDQGDTPHCVGFCGAQWGNTLPINDHFRNPDGHAIYKECKVVDGDPNGEDGTYVRSLAKVLKDRGRLSVYASTSNAATVKAFVLEKGPVVVGSRWYEGMDEPDQKGFINITGANRGGHCWLVHGYTPVAGSPTNGNFRMLNSWGPGWGDNGHAFVKESNLNVLLLGILGGDAMAAVELPL